MILIEDITIPDPALPLDKFKLHLRQGTGFGVDTLQDEVLLGFLRAAISAIEARTGKALISRQFSWSLTAWRDFASVVLPIAPVTQITSVTTTDSNDVETALDTSLFRLDRDSHRPTVKSAGAMFPTIPFKGSIKFTFLAGYAPDWSGLPADLGQAVLLLATHYYEYRHETALGDGCMPFGVTSLVQRYRSLRITPGYLS